MSFAPCRWCESGTEPQPPEWISEEDGIANWTDGNESEEISEAM